MAHLPCVLCFPLSLCGTGLAGGPEQHQAPQLAATGGGEGGSGPAWGPWQGVPSVVSVHPGPISPIYHLL